MTTDYLEQRFQMMLQRLADVYDNVGHSSGRPYLYFVYPPNQDQRVRRLADEQMIDIPSLAYLHIDLVPLTVDSLRSQEEKRTEHLNDPLKADSAGKSIVRIWARRLEKEIDERLPSLSGAGRPVIVLRGMAALYPLGNPTALMEAVAEHEPRDARTGKVIPFVLLVPGTNPPQSSRTYDFLGLESQRLSFYRGEEI